MFKDFFNKYKKDIGLCLVITVVVCLLFLPTWVYRVRNINDSHRLVAVQNFYNNVLNMASIGKVSLPESGCIRDGWGGKTEDYLKSVYGGEFPKDPKGKGQIIGVRNMLDVSCDGEYVFINGKHKYGFAIIAKMETLTFANAVCSSLITDDHTKWQQQPTAEDDACYAVAYQQPLAY